MAAALPIHNANQTISLPSKIHKTNRVAHLPPKTINSKKGREKKNTKKASTFQKFEKGNKNY
jgi:hypothetical protein